MQDGVLPLTNVPFPGIEHTINREPYPSGVTTTIPALRLIIFKCSVSQRRWNDFEVGLGAKRHSFIVYFLTAAGHLKSSCRHSASIRTKKSRNVNEDLQDEQT